jgi:hypothetical protein
MSQENSLETAPTQQQDVRPYVARFLFGKPILIAKNRVKLLAIEETVRELPVTELLVDGKAWTWCEVQYSQQKGKESIEEAKENASTMTGPDMYHLLDSDNKIRANIWIPVRLNRKIEVVYYDADENQIFTKLYDAASDEITVLQEINQYFNAEHYNCNMIEWNLKIKV